VRTRQTVAHALLRAASPLLATHGSSQRRQPQVGRRSGSSHASRSKQFPGCIKRPHSGYPQRHSRTRTDKTDHSIAMKQQRAQNSPHHHHSSCNQIGAMPKQRRHRKKVQPHNQHHCRKYQFRKAQPRQNLENQKYRNPSHGINYSKNTIVPLLFLLRKSVLRSVPTESTQRRSPPP